MARFLRLLLGILLLPLCFSVTWATLDTIARLPSQQGIFSPQLLWIAGGFLCWIVCWIVFRHPTGVYVFGHEMTHAVFGWLFFAKVSNLRVTTRGGSVMLSKDNILITLAPYFFPFYTMLLLLVRWIVSLFCNPVPCPEVWLFLTGFTWAFHLCFTIHSLCLSQPDCQQYGYLLSYVFIYLMNILGVGLWIVLATDDLSVKLYGKILLLRMEYVYYMLYRYTLLGWRRLSKA
ncbi:MAG: hypothetical protein J5985_08535 [Kiritimatiellae bacterium]|nr:hypothetical protein [Kiritimatiellia bacterium]